MIIDKPICDRIHKSQRTGGPIEYIIAVFAATFNGEILAFVWAIVLLILPWNWRSFFFCLLIPMSNLGIILTLKKLFARERPQPYIPRSEALMFDFRRQEKNKSMPSGDSAQAGALWMFLSLEIGISWYIGVVSTFMTMFSRVYYMCHYPSDTIVGATMGAFIAYQVHYLVKTFIEI